MLTVASWKEEHNWRGKLMRISDRPKPFLPKRLHEWGVVRCLIPDRELLREYRAGAISKPELSSRYLRSLEKRWDQVSTWLSSLSNDEDQTLLCHQPESRFCHRLLVADLVRKHRPDIEVAIH